MTVRFLVNKTTGYTEGYCDKRKEALLYAELFGEIPSPLDAMLKGQELAYDDQSGNLMVFASELKKRFPDKLKAIETAEQISAANFEVNAS